MPPAIPMTPATPTDPASELVLRDIHLPPPVSWWPPAPGWWILLILVLLLIGGGAVALSRYRRRRFQRIALRQLKTMEQQLSRDHNARLIIQKISKLLRHMAVLHYPADQCAGLYGEEWLLFLDKHFATDKKDKHPFSRGVGRLLLDLPYQPAQQLAAQGDAEKQFEEALALLRLSQRWLKKLPLAPRHGRST